MTVPLMALIINYWSVNVDLLFPNSQPEVLQLESLDILNIDGKNIFLQFAKRLFLLYRYWTKKLKH
jgi:hypothetical protein